MTEYPYGFCGMPCALCSRYRTDGTSRCPGCSCDGYYTDMCRVHHCCKDRKLAHCGLCGEYPCARLVKMSDFRDLDTGCSKQRTCGTVASDGFTGWYDEYAQRAELLTQALLQYNDGRMKRYLCELFLQNDIVTLRRITDEASSLNGTVKEKAKQFKVIAEKIRIQK